jgi:TetR/AcrR family transcriptional regulator
LSRQFNFTAYSDGTMSQSGAKRSNKSTAKPTKLLRRGGRVAVRLTDLSSPKAVSAEAAETAPPAAARARGLDVRERILRVALEYFGTFGFEGTSTRAVAERAEVTHTLVLYHFKSKDQLWIATVEDALKGYALTLNELTATASKSDARETLTKFIEQFVRMSAARPQIHRLMTMESNQTTKRLEYIIDHFVRHHFTFVRDLIRRGQADGSVRQCDPARLYYLIIGAGGTPFTLRTEYQALTGRDVFSEAEILRNIAFIYEIVFI